jgi:hypothetical protein
MTQRIHKEEVALLYDLCSDKYVYLTTFKKEMTKSIQTSFNYLFSAFFLYLLKLSSETVVT